MNAASLDNLPQFYAGTVWLVGAGPGDPGLLTLLALHAISNADVLVYDALVNEKILDLAPETSVKIYAGKRGGKPSEKQEDISLTLVKLAQQGKKVCRLKGGDPFVFGRGGEEAQTLAENNIAFRIVPGITAGIGGLAYSGIPLTHRDTNQSVTFLTGHDSSGTMPHAIDWPGLARSAQILVIYMGVKQWEKISQMLLDHGRSPEEPVAFVRNATLKDHQVLESCLGHSVRDLERSQIKPPVMVVVGQVVNLRRELAWFEQNLPRQGHIDYAQRTEKDSEKH